MKKYMVLLITLGLSFSLNARSILFSLVHGDITKQRFYEQNSAGIVNAANETLLGGEGIDGAIHTAASEWLRAECALAPEVCPGIRCPTGQARMTLGHDLLPLKIIHAVGPQGTDPKKEELLAQTYRSSLSLAEAPDFLCEHPKIPMTAYQYICSLQIPWRYDKHPGMIPLIPYEWKPITYGEVAAAKSPVTAIAFPAISTGIYGYPIEDATPIAINTVIDYLKSHKNSAITEVRFVVFSKADYHVYKKVLEKCSGKSFNVLDFNMKVIDPYNLRESSLAHMLNRHVAAGLICNCLFALHWHIIGRYCILQHSCYC